VKFTPYQERHGEYLEHWQAWKLGECESYLLPVDRPNRLEAALDQALVGACWNRGDTLAVQHSHAGRGNHTLWLYTIKQESKPQYRRDPITGEAARSQRLYPVLVTQTALTAPFAPVDPFDAFRDDPVGRDLTLVEQRDQHEKEWQS
jgi:hypothetical protein